MFKETAEIYAAIPFKRVFWALFLFSAASSFLSIVPFAALGWLVDSIASGQSPINLFDGQITDGETDAFNLSLGFVASSVLAVVVRNVFGIFCGYFGTAATIEYRRRTFSSVAYDRSGRLNNFDIGEKIQRSLRDTEKLESGFAYPLTTFLSDALDIFWITGLFLFISPPLVATAWLFVPVVIWVAWKQSNAQSHYYRNVAEIEAHMLEHAQRAFTNRVTVSSLAGETREVRLFEQLLLLSKRAQFKLSGMIGLLFALEGIGRQVGFAIVAFASILLLSKGEITVGQAVTVFGATTRFYAPVGALARFMPTMREVIVSLRRVQEITNVQVERQTQILRQVPSNFEISVNNPTVELSGGQIINPNFSFRICPGEVSILQAPSGSGKTTLLKAMQGLEGKVLSGVVVEQGAVHELNDIVEYISANSPLLTPTVSQEVNYPNDPDNHSGVELLNTLKTFDISHLHEDNTSTKDFSEGERVRVILARATLSKKPVLLIDEPFINLDSNAAAKVWEAIRLLQAKGKAILIVTHVSIPDVT